MDIQKFKFKRDTYRKDRGGYSNFLNIYCENCGNHVLLYQKDGSGPLKRMYLDRIMAPENLKQMQILPIKDVPNLICTYCDRLIAVSSIYKKENRKAFALFAYTVVKKRTKGVFPPKVKNVST